MTVDQAFKDLPKVVSEAVEAKYPKATSKRTEELLKGDGTLHAYEVLLETADSMQSGMLGWSTAMLP